MRKPKLAGGALLWLVGCAAAPPRPEPVPSPPQAAVISAEGNVAGAMASALNRAGHDCAPAEGDAGVQICDRNAPGRATLVVVFTPPMAHLASHYRRKLGVTCDEMVPVLNQLNLAVDGVKLVCVDERVTFVTSFLVPDNGLSERSLVEHAQRFQGQIQLLLREGELLPMLE